MPAKLAAVPQAGAAGAGASSFVPRRRHPGSAALAAAWLSREAQP
jgi:hypothetical protein